MIKSLIIPENYHLYVISTSLIASSAGVAFGGLTNLSYKNYLLFYIITLYFLQQWFSWYKRVDLLNNSELKLILLALSLSTLFFHFGRVSMDKRKQRSRA